VLGLQARPLPPFRRFKYDVCFESPTSGHTCGVFIDRCHLLDAPDIALAQCEVEYTRSRAVVPTDPNQVLVELDQIADMVEQMLADHGITAERGVYSKLSFLKEAVASIPVWLRAAQTSGQALKVAHSTSPRQPLTSTRNWTPAWGRGDPRRARPANANIPNAEPHWPRHGKRDERRRDRAPPERDRTSPSSSPMPPADGPFTPRPAEHALVADTVNTVADPAPPPRLGGG